MGRMRLTGMWSSATTLIICKYYFWSFLQFAELSLDVQYPSSAAFILVFPNPDLIRPEVKQSCGKLIPDDGLGVTVEGKPSVPPWGIPAKFWREITFQRKQFLEDSELHYRALVTSKKHQSSTTDNNKLGLYIQQLQKTKFCSNAVEKGTKSHNTEGK